jgi:hypothetical protein
LYNLANIPAIIYHIFGTKASSFQLKKLYHFDFNMMVSSKVLNFLEAAGESRYIFFNKVKKIESAITGIKNKCEKSCSLNYINLRGLVTS